MQKLKLQVKNIKYIKKIMRRTIVTTLFIVAMLFPAFAHAADVQVSANISSSVSKVNSKVTVSTAETLADPTSHFILITVQLFDAGNNPLPNLNVALSSSRGQVDIIEETSKVGGGASVDEMRKGKTDAQGIVSFRISSYYPGKTTITIVADQVITLDPVNLQFDPLPFPANVTITVTTPSKEITIYAPPQYQTNKLINNGTKIQIPWYWFLLFSLMALLLPILIILTFVNLRKIRLMERDALIYLQKIEQQEEQR